MKAKKGQKKPVAKKKIVTAAPKKKPVAKVTKLAPKKPAVEQNEVDEYVSKVVPWQRDVIQKLRNVLKSAAPHASESIKWGQPVYEHKGPFAYIKAHAAQVNFGFWRGAELDDNKRMLQGEGEKMRHVKILETHVLDELTLGAFVKQAFALNDKKGDPTKG
jgi:hypothetical protein